jgi:hypothetical protein
MKSESSYLAYDVEDNWEKFSYQNRYLDALASVFHMQSAVTAALEYKNRIYLSYSNDDSIVPSVKYISTFIKRIIQAVDSTSDDLLAVYLIYNVDFKDLIKLAKRFITSEECKGVLNELAQGIKDVTNDLDQALKKGYEHDSDQLSFFYKNSKSIVAIYKTILTNHYNEIGEYLERFIRPMQDSYKLYHHFKLGHGKDIEDIIILPNPHADHADVNVVACFPNNMNLIDKPYIGVSKLCCGYCHTYLDKNNYGHRGTHGVCDDLWSFPWFKKGEKSPLEEEFKYSVESIGEFDIKSAPPQHRKLSTDDFEKNIELTEEKSLFNLKKEMNFIESYIFFEGKSVPCKYISVDDGFETVLIGDKEFSYGTMGYFGVGPD